MSFVSQCRQPMYINSKHDTWRPSNQIYIQKLICMKCDLNKCDLAPKAFWGQNMVSLFEQPIRNSWKIILSSFKVFIGHDVYVNLWCMFLMSILTIYPRIACKNILTVEIIILSFNVKTIDDLVFPFIIQVLLLYMFLYN